MASHDESGEPGTAPDAVLRMLAAMRSVGLDVEALCSASGFSEAALAQRTNYLAPDEFMSIWRMATKQFGRGTLGLYIGAAIPKGTLLDYLAGASPTLRVALGQIARYIGLDSRNVKWALGARQPDGLTTFEEHPSHEPPAVPLQLREFGVAICTSRLYEWFERRPHEVWFSHAPLGPIDDYQRVLGCPVHFERELVGLRFDDASLEAPAHRHDPQLFRHLESHAERVLAETPATATFRERVRHAVVQRLREGEPGISSIAEALATSERSLQRRLQAEGFSFRDVVDEARHKLAVLYLADPALSLTDVAYMLGYSEGAAFTRAFKRWTGRAPSMVRSESHT
jgi:AraC-like DNA-binding protein